jgi:uncharacterized protein
MNNSFKGCDRIYGEFTIDEPVLIDLINSPYMQRLDRINQFGLPPRFYPYPGFTRFEHSLGVMLLLEKLGASKEEQAAGLIHDVSHTAFSHLVDWVLGCRENEDFQDKNLREIISVSDIPEILERHGFNHKKISDIESFGLLEKSAPDLCADRVDYALREFNTWAKPDIVSVCIDELVAQNEMVVFKSKETAMEFSYAYSKCQREHWGGAECTVRWELFSKVLKTGLIRGIISENEFYKDDESVIERLIESDNDDITKIFDILNKPRLEMRVNKINPEFNLKKKFRFVDPYILYNGELRKLSDIEPSYGSFLDKQRSINNDGINVDLME